MLEPQEIVRKDGTVIALAPSSTEPGHINVGIRAPDSTMVIREIFDLCDAYTYNRFTSPQQAKDGLWFAYGVVRGPTQEAAQ